MPGQSLEFKRFSQETLEEIVREASGARARVLPPQVSYLGWYLSHDEMRAQTIVVESPYLDRHYLAEYQGYYASALREIPKYTSRLHFFSSTLTEVDVIEGLSASGREDFVRALQAAYLGYVIVRPIPAVPIGRSVLRWYGEPRCYGPRPPPSRVHIFGVTLKAFGVQFHQQDVAVGACATAAVWCALAAVTRRDGGRSPTPLAVTQWGHESLPYGRALPAAKGMTREQMIGAINASGYSPDVFKPGGSEAAQEAFKFQLMTYLRSGIPVVLTLAGAGDAEGHAVTAVGFRCGDERVSPSKQGPAVPVMSKIYVHDDRFGPYARMVWVTEDGREESEAGEDAGANNDLQVRIEPRRPGFSEFESPSGVWVAIAPLYPKIRISAWDLYCIAEEVMPVIRRLVASARRESLYMVARFVPNGDYKCEAWTLGLEPRRAYAVTTGLFMSRYVGVLRFMDGDEWVADVLCDATDLNRRDPRWGAVVALIPAQRAALASIESELPAQFPHVRVL